MGKQVDISKNGTLYVHTRLFDEVRNVVVMLDSRPFIKEFFERPTGAWIEQSVRTPMISEIMQFQMAQCSECNNMVLIDCYCSKCGACMLADENEDDYEEIDDDEGEHYGERF